MPSATQPAAAVDAAVSSNPSSSDMSPKRMIVETEHGQIFDVEPISSKDNKYCTKCGKPGNKSCTFQFCKKCCIEQPGTCVVSLHNRFKSEKHYPDVVSMIDEAIVSRKCLYIRYTGGENPGTVRPVLPTSWVNINSKTHFKGTDGSTSPKTYRVDRINQYAWDDFQ